MNKIELCKKCKNRQMDLQQGITCGLTNKKPTFIEKCENFEKDETLKQFQGHALRPNNMRAKFVLFSIGIVLILDVISSISSGMQYNLLQTAENGGLITNEAATANDLRESVIGIIYFIAYLTSAIAFIMWFRRAYFNLHQKFDNLSFGEGWAAGSWFVPIVNLYRPYQIMQELYKKTKKHIDSLAHTGHINLSAKALGLWWGLWITNNVIGQVSYRISKYADTITELKTMTTFDLINCVIGIALAFVTLKVIKDYSRVEDLLNKEVQ